MIEDSDVNPYASSVVPPPMLSSAAEETRQRNYSFESSVRAVGIVFFLAAVAGVLVGVALVGQGIEAYVMTGSFRAKAAAYRLVIGIGCIAYGVHWFIVGERLMSLNEKARMPAIVNAVFGLLAFPFGTIASIYLLCRLTGERARFIFSDQYKSILSETASLKYRQSGFDWFKAVVILICYVVGAAIVITTATT